MPRQPELWSASTAFAGTLLFGILNGILVGVLVTLLAVLHRLSRPRVAVLGKVKGGKRHRDIHRHPDAKTREGVLIVRFEAPVFFANADYLHQSVLRLLDDQQPHPDALVLVCDAMSDIDLTGIDALRELIADVQLPRRRAADVPRQGTRCTTRCSRATSSSSIGPEHFYDSVRAAKKGLKPDGLPVVPDWAKPADDETQAPAP